MNRAQRMAVTKPSPDLHHEPGAVPPRRWYPLGSGACCAAALLLVFLSCPAFGVAAGDEAHGDADADKVAQAPSRLRSSVNVFNAQPASAQRKTVRDPIVAYGLAATTEIERHWRYPSWGTRMLVRTTGVMVWIDPQGKITDARIVASSGDAELDASALRAVHEVGTLPPPPTGWKGRMRVNFRVDDPHSQPPSKVENTGNATSSLAGE